MPLTDEDLLQAIRAQILANAQGRGNYIEARQRARQEDPGDSIAVGMTPEDWDYFVDIERRDLPDINEATGKPAGWLKKVHRYTTKKGEEPPPPGKKRKGGR